ncbi:MAG: GNAT family N-acetyltransferase [Parabacteroides gordonii]|uniref:GNAT family N-acetyltransferase n=1 Tax=Parabacteroides gordonii TaxID=574930 RepID=UPI003A85BB78
MIRELQFDDIERCVQICEDNFKRLGYSYDVNRELELAILENQYAKPYYYVYEQDGIIIAFFGFSESGWDSSSYGLGPCYIDESFQCQGIGRLCTTFRIEQIKKLGGKNVFATVLKETQWHLERFGFKEIGPPHKSNWIIMGLFMERLS